MLTFFLHSDFFNYTFVVAFGITYITYIGGPVSQFLSKKTPQMRPDIETSFRREESISDGHLCSICPRSRDMTVLLLFFIITFF